MSEVISINSAEDLNSTVQNNDTVVVKFTAPSWCAPCRQLAPHYESAAEKSDATFVAVDIDDNAWAVVDFGVKGVPTVMLFRNGQYDKNIVGRTVVQILSELK